MYLYALPVNLYIKSVASEDISRGNSYYVRIVLVIIKASDVEVFLGVTYKFVKPKCCIGE